MLTSDDSLRPYEIHSLLGAGGMGGLDHKLKQRVNGDGRCGPTIVFAYTGVVQQPVSAPGLFRTAFRSSHLMHGLMKLIDKIRAGMELRGIGPTPAS